MSIAIQANFSKATTLVDGGWRLSFDCGEQMADQVIEASKLKGENLLVVVMTEAEYHEQKGQR